MSEMPIEEVVRYVAYLATIAALLSIIDTLRTWLKKGE
jgi:hypothetical protein